MPAGRLPTRASRRLHPGPPDTRRPRLWASASRARCGRRREAHGGFAVPKELRSARVGAGGIRRYKPATWPPLAPMAALSILEDLRQRRHGLAGASANASTPPSARRDSRRPATALTGTGMASGRRRRPKSSIALRPDHGLLGLRPVGGVGTKNRKRPRPPATIGALKKRDANRALDVR